jgi:hypothetical protein
MSSGIAAATQTSDHLVEESATDAYVGWSTPLGRSVMVRGRGGALPLSATASGAAGSFSWGAPGSKPIELARAILFDACGDAALARDLSLAFTWQVVGSLPLDYFCLPRGEVEEWIAAQPLR